MKFTKKYLSSVEQTGAAMRRLACNYCADLGRWLSVPFVVYYRHVCELPYIPDPPEVETVSRPLYTLNARYSPRDCDDKSVLLAAWLHAHGENAALWRPVRDRIKYYTMFLYNLKTGYLWTRPIKRTPLLWVFTPFSKKLLI